MTRQSSIAFFLMVLAIVCMHVSYGQDGLAIWKEFIASVKAGSITSERIRPYEQLGDAYIPTLLGFLDSLRAQASPQDWLTQPEVIRIDNRIQFVVPWTAHNQKVSYCLSFVTEGNRWYFQHLETIFIRLDKIPHPPTSDFPDVSEQQKNWAREEIFWSFVVLNIYLPLANEKGKESALNVLKDGAGYFVSARAWVPFSSPQKAFILYLCWEQSHLRGNDVTLQQLNATEAIVRLNTHFFALYSTATHLRPRISFEDYKQIFETIWQDRASNAGWRLEIRYLPDQSTIFHFRR